MLYVFYGSDVNIVREKANNLVQGLLNKKPNAEVVRVSEENFNTISINGLLATQGLFKSNYIIYLDNLNEEYKKWNKDEYKNMQQSEHICILVAEKLSPVVLKVLKENSASLSEYKINKIKSQYNIFNIANALKNRDKKRLWLEFIKVKSNNTLGESIVGILFWAVKDMLLKKQYNKWSESELKKISIILANLPHEARINRVDTNNALEYWILNL